MVACFIVVFITELLHLPVFFGYVTAGIIVGQYNLIHNAVQVETISRGLGVIFIMFFLGLEFNVEKIKRVWSIALAGTMLLIVGTISCCVWIGRVFQGTIQESIMIGASVFLSSTAVVLHLIKPSELETVYGRNIIGILVVQDVMLGFLLAMMPVLQSSGVELAYIVFKLIGMLFLFLFVSFLCSYPYIMCLNWLNTGRKEIFLMASVAFVLVIVQIGSLMDQSIEMACFVAGMLLASQRKLTEDIFHILEPLKQVFGALFFASIGLHIYPSFLISEGGLLLLLTLLAILFKIVFCFALLLFVFRLESKTCAVIAVGLGQISEFTFVLASKAKG